jgi:hypothetical protein
VLKDGKIAFEFETDVEEPPPGEPHPPQVVEPGEPVLAD